MSKLEELIQQYCPDGVEFIPLGKVCDFISGFAFKASLFQKEGEPICKTTNIQNDAIDFSNMECFHLDDYDTNLDRYIINPQDIVIGMSGTIKVGINNSNNKCYLNQRVGKFSPNKSILNNKYLFYILLNSTEELCEGITGGSVKNLSNDDIKNLEIPVPPLPVQEEIVRILDTFTELQAELQAELQKRLQQYNYYKEILLSEGEGESLTIPSFTTLKAGKAIKAEELSDAPDAEHMYPCYGGNGIRGYIGKYSHNGDYAIIGRQGALCGCVNWASGEFYATEHAVVCTPQKNVCSRFLYYLFDSANLNQYKSQGAQPGLSVQRLNELSFRIPSLAEQQKIVDILDRFDSLTTGLTAGLPAEIEKRKQQYEYYRDKLLTFKRINA